MKSEEEFLIENYHLKDKKTLLNTFLVRVPAENSLYWWTDREKDLMKWNKVLNDSSELNKNFLFFIVGSYGRGKTLSLYKISEEAKKYPVLYPINLNFLGEEKSTGGLDFIFRIFRNIDFYRLINQKDSQLIHQSIENIPDKYGDSKNILRAIYQNELQKDWFSSIDPNQKTHSKSRSQVSQNALLFLQGEKKLTSPEMNKLGIQRKIDKIDNAKKYLAGLLIFIKNIGYQSLVLSIDEFEYLSLVPPSQRGIYIALLRGLYDLPSEMRIDSNTIANLVFFIAISEDGWVKLKDLEERESSSGGPTVALLRRSEGQSILGAFNKKNTYELISLRLKWNRDGNHKEEPLIPFSQDFVDYIHERTLGEPREIIIQCGDVLQKGIAQRVPKLTKKFAQEVLEQNIE